jgi:hypothetical protein
LAERTDHPLVTMQREIDLAIEKACQALECGNPPVPSIIDDWPAVEVTEDEN